MTARAIISRLLWTDPADAGCEHTGELLHVYAEHVAAGRDAGAELPGVAAHLASCDGCEDDLAGLLALIAPA
jgi:hypothetical protein